MSKLMFLFVSTMTLLAPLAVIAQEQPDKMVIKFFELYEKNSDEAFNYLYSNNEWMQRSQDDIDYLKTQIKNATAVMGEYYGYEIITSRQVGESFVLYSFMVKYDRQPIRFIFEFYKPKDKWKTYGFSFDEDMDDDIENSAREGLGK